MATKENDNRNAPEKEQVRLESLLTLFDRGAHLTICDDSKAPMRTAWEEHAPTCDEVIDFINNGQGIPRGRTAKRRLVGMMPKSLSLVVVDVDHGGEDAVTDLTHILGRPLVTCPSSQPGRFHCYWKFDGEMPDAIWETSHGGGEIRASSGQIILWHPRMVADALNARDRGEIDTPTLTPEVIDKIRKKKTINGVARANIVDFDEPYVEGNRNNQLNARCFVLGKQGRVMQVRRENKAVVEAGFSEKDARKVSQRAFKEGSESEEAVVDAPLPSDLKKVDRRTREGKAWGDYLTAIAALDELLKENPELPDAEFYDHVKDIATHAFASRLRKREDTVFRDIARNWDTKRRGNRDVQREVQQVIESERTKFEESQSTILTGTPYDKIRRVLQYWNASLRFDILTGEVQCIGFPFIPNPGWLVITSARVHNLRMAISDEFSEFTRDGDEVPALISHAELDSAVTALSDRNPVNAFATDVLDNLPPWNPDTMTCPSTDLVVASPLGVELGPNDMYLDLYKETGRIILQAVVARSQLDRDNSLGIKFDLMPVLIGVREGEGKSTFWQSLLPDPAYHSGSFRFNSDLKKMREEITGKVLVECGEMGGYQRSDMDAIKTFLTDTMVPYVRESYGRGATGLPKMCVLVGTTNDKEFLPQGEARNRRWVPILCVPQNKPGVSNASRIIEWLDEVMPSGETRRTEMFAHAIHCYREGMPLYFSTPELEDAHTYLTGSHRRQTPEFDDIVMEAFHHFELNNQAPTTEDLIEYMEPHDDTSKRDHGLRREIKNPLVSAGRRFSRVFKEHEIERSDKLGSGSLRGKRVWWYMGQEPPEQRKSEEPPKDDLPF